MKTLPKRLALITLLTSASFATTACDTAARISFENITLDKVDIVGIAPAQGSCQGSNGDANIQFVLINTERYPITDESFGGVTLGATDIRFSNAAVFSTPDQTCSACASDRFICDVIQPDFTQDMARCHQLDQWTVQDAPTFMGVDTERQFFGVLMEESASLYGTLPSSLTTLYPDLDGDGLGDNIDSQRGPIKQRATDASISRRAGLSRMVTSWSSMTQWPDADANTQYFFGSWRFGDGVRSMIADVTPTSGNQNAWTSSPQSVLAATGNAKWRLSNRTANLYEAADQLLNDPMAYANPKYIKDDKILVLFTDGIDDLRLTTNTPETVIEAAKKTNTSVYVVHLDVPIQTKTEDGAPLVFDDPTYIRAQEGCQANTECKHFERCRPITGFSQQAGLSVNTPSPARLAKSYCMPHYDDNGRIGPVDDYAQMACATGGRYIHVKRSDDLPLIMARLPYLIHGAWEVDVKISSFAHPVESSTPRLLQTTMSATIEGTTIDQTFDQRSGLDGDRRMVLFQTPPN